MRFQALLVGQSHGLMRALPVLLQRAGFSVDVVSTARQFRSDPLVRRFEHVVSAHALVTKALHRAEQGKHDLVVIGDDETLREVVTSDLSVHDKLRLLPVATERDLEHVGSKVAFSRVLERAGVQTPAFWVAQDPDELQRVLSEIAHPVLIKIDRSGGGSGVFEFSPGDDISRLFEKPWVYPVLVQERIKGEVVDLSAFYQNGQLIHFSYSEFLEVISNKFGPSSVRRYTPISQLPQAVYGAARGLGMALGASGFVNVTCIKRAADGAYFFIEGDMRPNTWVGYPRFLGDDPAGAIHDYFAHGNLLGDPLPAERRPEPEQEPETLLIPYVFRLSAWEIATNRHDVWHYLDGVDPREIIAGLLWRPVARLKRQIIGVAVGSIKPRVTAAQWQTLRRLWHASRGRAVPALPRQPTAAPSRP